MRATVKVEIERARVDARCRRHEAAEAVHLLSVVIQTKAADEAFRGRGIDPVELRERLEAELTSHEGVGGYRDGGEAPIAASLERVIARVDARSWKPFAPRVSLIDALLAEPSIAALVVDLRRGDDYRHIVERARALAVVSRHAAVEIEHVFRVLLDVRSFVQTAERAGAAVEPVARAVDEALRAMPVDPDCRRLRPLGRGLRLVIASAEEMAEESGMKVASIRQLCLQLAWQDECKRFWTAAGIEAADFVRAVHAPDDA